jgi:hypothetical protein
LLARAEWQGDENVVPAGRAEAASMIRFLLGVLIGATAMYWYLTGEIPYRAQVEQWIGRASTAYKGEQHRAEADRIIGAGKATRSP